jgi:hypothetical protein
VPGYRRLKVTQSGFGLYRREGDEPTRSAPRRPRSSNGRVWPTPEAYAATLGGEPGGTWYYQRADGTTALAVVRVNTGSDKTYRPLHPVPGGWAVGDPKGPLPLYKLPELGSNARTWVFEGELCVDTGRAIGLAATTSAYGAMSARKTDWQPLAGKDVVIVPDHDEHGEAYAADVARILLSLTPPATVRVVRLKQLWPDIVTGGDIVDYREFRECLSDDDLRRGLEELADATPPTTPDSIRAPIETDRARMALPDPVPLSQLGDDPAIPWAWYGYWAVGFLTLLVGLWKAGKTTLLAHLLRLLDDGGDLAGIVKPGRVLVVSEEGKGLWARRRDELGIGDHVEVMSRPLMGRPSYAEWLVFVEHLVGLVKARGFAAVVFDTISSVWPVEKENDASAVIAALMPLHRLCEAGVAVLLIHHPRKGDGTEGQASRGSGALTGFVDIIMELRRYAPEDSEDRRRTLTAYSRFSETPTEAVIELTDAGYQKVGTKIDAKRADRLEVIGDLLPKAAPGMTAEELRPLWPTDGPPKPSLRTLRVDLKRGIQLGLWRPTGKGAKGDPLRYWVEDSIRARSGSYGARNESSDGDTLDERVMEHVAGAETPG